MNLFACSSLYVSSVRFASCLVALSQKSSTYMCRVLCSLKCVTLCRLCKMATAAAAAASHDSNFLRDMGIAALVVAVDRVDKIKKNGLESYRADW